jgi:hypothetical protein
MSDLRTRIAAAMRKEFYENEEATDDDCTWVNWELMADAVIQELGLRKQEQTGEIVNIIEGDGINYGRHRYVTDWKADNATD